MNLDEIIYSLRNLTHRKLRSWLTVLSILLGIMTIFAIVSFGLGIRSYMDTLAEEAGIDTLYIQAKSAGAPGTDENFMQTKDDLDFVSKIKGVKEISGMYMKVGEIKHDKNRAYSFVIGFDPEDWILKTFTVDIVKGRQLKTGEADKVALGYNYQFDDKVLKKALRLGDNAELNGKNFDVVGFYEEVGNPQDDSQIYLTYKGMEELYPDVKNKFGFIILKAEKNVDTEALADKIKDKLRKHKGQEEGKEDFYVQTFSDLLATFNIILTVLNGILVLIALISLVVASVNITNTMYTAVLERTQEIGIMKAVGAKNSEILLIFVVESGLLGMVGGIVGVIFGYAIAKTGGVIAASYGYAMLKPVFPAYLTIGCILFGFFTGAIAGILPARQASRLKPVDALRYE